MKAATLVQFKENIFRRCKKGLKYACIRYTGEKYCVFSSYYTEHSGFLPIPNDSHFTINKRQCHRILYTLFAYVCHYSVVECWKFNATILAEQFHKLWENEMNVLHTYISLRMIENVYKLLRLWSTYERRIHRGTETINRWLSKLFGTEEDSDMPRCFGCLILAFREVYSVVLTRLHEIMEVNPYFRSNKESW